MHTHYFDHESLHCYRLLAEVARWYLTARFPRGTASLRNQGLEAAQSAALNLAEGRSRKNNARINHYEIAKASAAEACAVLDLVDIPGAPSAQQKLRRAGAMLTKLGA
jgi:four helix bundle protein